MTFDYNRFRVHRQKVKETIGNHSTSYDVLNVTIITLNGRV
jgi:hypothetical protein